MTDSDKKSGFTPIPNDLYDAINLFDFSKRELKAVHAIIRKTIGWNKDLDYISGGQISMLTGLTTSASRASIRSLIEQNIVLRIGRNIGINKDFKGWKIKQTGPKRTGTGSKQTGSKQTAKPVQNEPAPVQNEPLNRSKTDRTKERKTTLQETSLKTTDEEQEEMDFPEDKKNDIGIPATKKKKRVSKSYQGGPPPGVEQEYWDEFLEIRLKQKAVNSELAIKIIFNKLSKFQAEGHNPQQLIENAIAGGWKSVFAPKKIYTPKQAETKPSGPSVWDDDYNPQAANLSENLNGSDYDMERTDV